MTMTSTRPSSVRLFLFLFALPVLALIWIVALKVLIISGYSSFGDASMIRRLLLLILPPLLLAGGACAGYSAWARRCYVGGQRQKARLE